MLDHDQILVEHLNNSRVAGREWSIAGGRYKSYDIQLGVEQPARFELKTLHLSDRGLDRRFKIGGPRTQTVYGRLDSKLRRAALNLEDHFRNNRYLLPIGMTEEQMRSTLAAVHAGRHGKRNMTLFRRLCWMFEEIVPGCAEALKTEMSSQRIYEGFQDLAGVFFAINLGKDGGRRLVYTLVPSGVIPSVVEFDSSGAEGVKLRYVGELPAELRDKRKRKEKQNG